MTLSGGAVGRAPHLPFIADGGRDLQFDVGGGKHADFLLVKPQPLLAGRQSLWKNRLWLLQPYQSHVPRSQVLR